MKKRIDFAGSIVLGVALLLLVGNVLLLFFIVNRDSKKVEDKYPLDLSYEYDGRIPSISQEGNSIPIGVEMPEVQNEWADGVEPLFLYTHPELWEKMYLIEGLDWVVVKVKHYYLCVTPMGPVGPVWAYCRYSDLGKFYGISSVNHAFLFLHHGELKVVRSGDNFQEVVGVYDEMDLLEQNCVFKGNEVLVEMPQMGIEIQSLEEALVDYNEEIGVAMIANTTKEFFDVDVIQIFEGEMKSLPGKNGDRVFRIQKPKYGDEYEDPGDRKEALFIGAIDDHGVSFRMPFRGEIVEINEYGILHKAGETERFTPFSPVVINGELFFAEYSPEFFETIKGYYLKDENAPEGEAKTETETETETETI